MADADQRLEGFGEQPRRMAQVSGFYFIYFFEELPCFFLFSASALVFPCGMTASARISLHQPFSVGLGFELNF